MNKPEALVDLLKLSEDERIDLIGHTVYDHGKIVTVLVDADPDKADRYIRKLQTRYPGIIVLDRGVGPVEGVVWVKLGPSPHRQPQHVEPA